MKIVKKCFECDSELHVQDHHVVPKCLGGKRTIPLCEVCHGKVHNMNMTSRFALQRIGIEKAKNEGKYKGRKCNSKNSVDDILSKHQNVVVLLNENRLSIRKIAKITNRAINTVIKVRELNNEIYL